MDEQDLLFLDPREIYDPMILGVLTTFEGHTKVAYDKDKILSYLEQDAESNGSLDPQTEAVEYFEFNMQGAYLGEATPVYISREELELFLAQEA